MTKRALCVGINRFRDREINALRGCVNDARNFASLLTGEFGFAGSNVRVILDAEGTKAGYLDGLDWLVGGAQPGDELVLVTSSHGSHIPDSNSDEQDDEDEVLVVHDHDWSRVILTDDAIARQIARLPRGVSLVTLWDTCHSGTMNDTAAYTNRGARRKGLNAAAGLDVVGKYVDPPWHGTREVDRATRQQIRAAQAAAGAGGNVDTSHVATLHLAACRDDETAADAGFSGGYAGAFLHSLQAAIREQPGATWEDAFQRARRKVQQGGFDQTPEMYGPAELRRSPLFGGRGPNSGRVAVTNAGVPQGMDKNALARLDQQIGFYESQGNWRSAAQVLQQRVAAVTSAPEKVRTLEHMVSLYRVQLRDEAGALRTCEALYQVDPNHAGARQYLTWAYQQQGNTAKLQALQSGTLFSKAAPGAPAAPASGGILGSVQSAFGSAVAGVTAAATGAASAIEQSNKAPAWMSESSSAPQAAARPAAPQAAAKPAAPRCPYCKADVAAAARSCAACGGAW